MALLLGVAAAGAASAQTAAPADVASVEELVVTGTRVVRDGYQAPTPLTVISETEILAAAPSNVADFVNDIPSIVGSATPQTSNASISAGTSGVNALNLRGLGATRTLVLLNGQRSVGSTITGAVDVNTFPQGLISGVQIVTGGASAAYGSDAVSGVVNFILDTDYQGFKGSIEGGQTTYGDDDQYRVNLTYGTQFAGGRGHLLLNGEIVDREGIYGVPRDWNNDGWYIITNPNYVPGNGQPERFVTRGAGLSNATPGGIIVNTPLRGTTFGVGGVVGQQAYGLTRDPWMIGGDWQSVQVNDKQSLNADDRRKGFFGRVSYDLTDNIEIFGQVSYNEHASLGWTGVQFNQGNVTIRSDNAFLPANIRQQLAALNIASFSLGTTNADLPIRKTDNERSVTRYVVGAEGDFTALDRDWRWDAYYQRGETETLEIAKDITNNARLALAQDAVFAPNGDIVCRSTLTNPTNGCVPFNRMGIGVNSQAALDYILGDPQRKQFFTQQVAAANISGDPFSTWAGPVSMAAGIEHRKEEVSGEVPTEYRSGWFVGNYLPTFGSYTVTEAYLEAVIPLADNFDLNAAVRGTDYSTSGYVTTWKVGAVYSPIEDIRFRVTRSRDIRAPNLNELFAAGTSRTNTLLDPFNNNQSTQFLEVTTGNLNLQPELADTWGVGVVLQPTFLPGFAAAIDYFDIQIEGAIGSVLANTIVDRCFQGNQEYCAAITRSGNQISQVSVSPFNFAVQKSRGLDLEASYRFNLGDGAVALRAVGTYYLENYEDNGIDVPTDNAGSIALPEFIYRATATYTADPWTIQVTGRGVSDSKLDNAFVECTTGCPASTIANRTINNNHVDGAFYVDLAMTYDLKVLQKTEAFVSISNLFNRDPEIVPQGPAGTAYGNPSTSQGIYDILGRVFRVGVRFEY
ncbi:TonB-dependent siderophore receptor [Phenylobacterium sp.]|uniref:TonB-dependent receptor plug domain-containing protein n=1 Tax=Phenylobacterium sp. TaxID=1871053 RepID=UPI00272F1D2F|nr:TonB-dependent receptor [Phenylobacterium sp.]MDP1616341.1 TonB-dependent receptor [Phenylobacterium sp.]MDP1988383.1 TonB-dependent receptor [Phenylobacterium sp.]